MLENNPEFFASMNTVKGFQNYFSEIFDPNHLEMIYILKGGPGTGKSSLMKSIANDAEMKGFTTERYLCSADSNSLDGVIIKEKKLAVIDGTAPHTADPSFPGIVENIINLGEFWDTKKLFPHKSKILELIREKKRSFLKAYQFLSAQGEVASEIFSNCKRIINQEKLKQNVKVQAGYFFQKQTKGKTEIKNIESFSKNGKIKLSTFEDMSEKIWVIEDCSFSAYAYLEVLFSYARNQNQNMIVSFSPLFTELPNGIYFPDSKSSFTIGKREYEKEEEGKEYHYINMKRFLDLKELSKNKQKIKFAEKCLRALEEGAREALQEAAKLHEELEKFYMSAMDFEKNEQLKKAILSSILDKNK